MRGGRRGRVARGGEGHSSRALSRLAGPLRPKRGRDGRWCCSRRSSRVARPVLRRSRRVRGRGTAVRRRESASRSSQQPERARARPGSYPLLGPKRQRVAGAGLRSHFVRPMHAFEYALAVPAGSQGPPAPLRRRCPPGRCSGGALVTPRRRLRPEGRGRGRGEQRGRERDGARLPNEPHGLRLPRRGHLPGPWPRYVS